MSYDSYANLITLEEDSFIAGSSRYLDFKIYDENGVPATILGKTLEWSLCPWGKKDFSTLIKTEVPYISGGITYGGGVSDLDDYTKRVTLDPDDTINLSGKYTQQIVVKELGQSLIETTYVPCQGDIIILSKIYRP